MAENDRISELPESLITQILSYLPTKDSVKTSVLSSRWKNLWFKVPGLDLDLYNFRIGHRLVSFVDRFLEFNPELRFQKLKVKCKYLEEIEWLKESTDAAINRGVQHLDVKSRTCYADGDLYPLDGFMPLNLYTSKTLVSLKLSFSGIDDPEFVYMPCLKSMHLVEFQRRTNLEKLFLGCPVLEELILVRSLADEFPVTCVRSRSLKRFCVPFRYGRYCKSRVESTLEIDAPGLEYMSLKEDQFDRYVVKDLTCLFTVDLDINFLGMFNKFLDKSKRKGIGDFLTGISSVRHMIISQKTVEALKLYSKRGLIPKFNNVSRLQAEFPCDLLQFLPAFLESFPNLKHLILKLIYPSEEMKVFKLKDVPRCFLSTLECVEIKGICEWEEEEMQIARYFLENSAVLKKLVVSRVDDPRRVLDSEIYEELNKLTKRSPSCQITIDCDYNLLCNHK